MTTPDDTTPETQADPQTHIDTDPSNAPSEDDATPSPPATGT